MVLSYKTFGNPAFARNIFLKLGEIVALKAVEIKHFIHIVQIKSLVEIIIKLKIMYHSLLAPRLHDIFVCYQTNERVFNDIFSKHF